MESKHHRRSVRLHGYDYSQPGAYFVTIVTQGRLCVFGQVIDRRVQLSEKGHMAQDCWREIPEHFPRAELGAYVVMPNHLHGILILHERDRAAISSPPVGATHWVAPTTDGFTIRPIGPQRGSIGAIIGACKMAVTRMIVKQFGGAPDIWQRNYYEHVVRNEEELNGISQYIDANPDNWEFDEDNV